MPLSSNLRVYKIRGGSDRYLVRHVDGYCHIVIVLIILFGQGLEVGVCSGLKKCKKKIKWCLIRFLFSDRKSRSETNECLGTIDPFDSDSQNVV